ncbi:hypothetical protein LTR56_014089 [Elasticomyces elasticus]|nr:hypothetical protein LTR22_020005 [Elasticomyces elasticus]KAK3636616.1 hypothetical protein LTR56_014089 [Elasticomyces elasticus]KAK4910912.1 hypothetical protein LTR49_020438 [Elasticomyces elasticus]KAK5759997.1 hypothetical protein LTS12_009893 [Elasticomyces elasticus]
MITGSSTASLFGLPREIRDQIIAYVLVHIKDPPLHYWASSSCQQAPSDLNAKPRTDHPDISFTKLRDVNHQLREEVADHCRAAYRPNEAKANLDISFSGQFYSPTWTYVPALLQPGRLFDLNINARILSTESFKWHSRSLVGSGYWSLYYVINDLFRCGPSLDFARYLRDTDDICSLKTLTVSFSFHDPYTPDTWPVTATEIVRRMQLFATSGVLHPHIERLKVSISYEASNSCYSYNEDWPIEPSVDGVDVSLDDWLQRLA